MASRVVPALANDVIPITGLVELQAHMGELIRDPSTPLDPKLFDDVELQLTEANTLPVLPTLLPPLTEVLHTTPHDPAIPASLAQKLLAPLSFRQALSLADEDSLLTALSSSSPAANLLALTILAKAADTPADATILSTLPRLVDALLRRWLASPHVEVGERATRVLGDALATDCELPAPPPSANGTEVTLRRAPGHGRLWRRIFLDRAVLALIVAHVRGTAAPEQTPRQTSLAQGRVLRLLPRLAALNFPAVAASPFEDVVGGDGGLLHFAALRMVDRADPLMHLSLVDFFEAFVSIMRVTEHSARKTEEIRDIVADATRDDEVLRAALLTLSDRTVPEEAELLRSWIREIMGPR